MTIPMDFSDPVKRDRADHALGIFRLEGEGISFPEFNLLKRNAKDLLLDVVIIASRFRSFLFRIPCPIEFDLTIPEWTSFIDSRERGSRIVIRMIFHPLH